MDIPNNQFQDGVPFDFVLQDEQAVHNYLQPSSPAKKTFIKRARSPWGLHQALKNSVKTSVGWSRAAETYEHKPCGALGWDTGCWTDLGILTSAETYHCLTSKTPFWLVFWCDMVTIAFNWCEPTWSCLSRAGQCFPLLPPQSYSMNEKEIFKSSLKASHSSK